jgi:DNA-binding FrmR family transcriptional regulator
MLHDSHPQIVKRLKRADGHLQTIIGMFDEGRSCLDLAQQLQAVENAVANAKKALIRDHIDHCLDRSVRMSGPKGRAALAEFKAITKYL